MTMKWKCFCFISLLLAACSSSSSPPPSGPIAGWPNPAPGQWASGNYAQVVTPNLGTSFAIPGGNGLHYVYTRAPANLATASKIVLIFTVSGNATFGISDPTDGPPPQVDLFIWQAGDNLTCQGSYVNDRVFSNTRAPLQNGTNILTAVLADSDWHNCYGQPQGLSQAIGGAA